MTGNHGRRAFGVLATACLLAAPARAQTGVDDDRVSLPEGPGSLEGIGENVAVDPNMGLMSYEVPLAAPQGFAGLSPDLALSYSSGSGSGLVGIGWNLATPTIERMTSKGVPAYDVNDRFAANGGEELVLVEPSPAGRTYRARYEGGFVRYTWHDSGSQGHWTAEYPDGRIGYFGADRTGAPVAAARSGAAGQGTWRFHLVDLVDRFGNRLHWDYDRFDGNVPLPVAASYLYVGDAPRHVVRLAYEERPDLISDCTSGQEEVLRYRLSNVRVSTNGELTREYALDYQDDAISGGASRLRGVRTFGVGGVAGNQRLPAQFGFDYSRALGVDCDGNEAACTRPYVVDMGVLQGAVNLAGGAATLMDMNGDGLPDVLDTSGDGPHRFYINQLGADGGHGFSAPIESRVAEGDAFRLSGNVVQELDLDGNGYADLLNTQTGAWLLNAGSGTDWAAPGEGLDVAGLPNFASADTLAGLRFTDFDNDKQIDILASTSDSTSVYVNRRSSFSLRQVDPIGAGFATANLQLADMNGDGLNDPVEVLEGGGVRYRLALGRGRWTEWRVIPGLDVSPSEQPFVDLEDLNGDGLADLVIVTPNEIKYAVNRNANRFDAFRTVAADEVEGDLPERADGVTVLYADMNANGSEDIVWFDPNGRVRYLELFPVRPHLLSRIENNLGMVQVVTYASTVEQAAHAEEPWDVSLPYPMQVVARTDVFSTLTGGDDGSGVHEVTEYTYRNGYYDGVEKQFRGFTEVAIRLLGDDFQEEGLTRLVYDAGIEDDYRNGLLLSREVSSGGRPLQATTYGYTDCPVAGVPEDLATPVRHVCPGVEETVHQEGAPPAEWVTTRIERGHDVYGNPNYVADHGVFARGGQPCGAACEGDERFEATLFASPETTREWLLRLPVHRSIYARPGDEGRSEERFYYDGEAFAGLPEGQATRGFLSRRTLKVDARTVVEAERNRATERGEIAETIDPNGDPAEANAHRRVYSYDDAGRLLTGITEKLTDADGQPYELRRTFRYDERFQNMSETTERVLFRDGQAASPVNTRRFRYDALGFLVEQREMGDAEDAPTLRLAYEFGDPVSRLATRRRLNGGETLAFRCFDGQGRAFQERTQVAAGRFQVAGFKVFNRRGEVVREYQPYTAPSGDCDAAPPAQVAYADFRYDALGRVVGTTAPDASLYDGVASVTRTEYRPLREVRYDAEDADPQSPHRDTPTTFVYDGLERPVAIERRLGQATAAWNLTYDNLGNLATVTDPAGNVHRQTFDLLNRAVRVESPHHGTTQLAWDAAGNLVSRTDGRGVAQRREYDGANRLVARLDGDGRATRWTHDADPDCDAAECTNTAGRVASVTYPVGLAGIDAGEDRFGYDARGRQVFAARRLGDVDLPVRRAFDTDDRLTSRVHADGTAFEMRYDGAGRLVGVPGLLTEVTWDDRGRLGGVQYANGARETRGYDVVQRLATLRVDDAAGTPILRLDLGRGRTGNLREITDMAASRGGSRALTAGTDDWYRPTSVAYGDGETVTLTFGELDEVLSRTSSLGADSAAHVGDLEYTAARATRAGDVEYGYDGAGQVAQRAGQALAWDDRGNLAGAGDGRFAAAYGPDGMPVATLDDGALTLYGFDDFEVRDGVAYSYVRVDGRRAARRATPGFGTNVYEDHVADGVISAADAYEADADADALLMAAARRVIAENEDATAYLHGDHLGSLVAATDEGGEVRGARDFFPYGATRWETGWVDGYGYTGQRHFASTGLVHFANRPLDPWSGRWAAPDPAFEVLAQDAAQDEREPFAGYAYVDNDALTKTDPDGLFTPALGNKLLPNRRVRGNLKARARQLDEHHNGGGNDNDNRGGGGGGGGAAAAGIGLTIGAVIVVGGTVGGIFGYLQQQKAEDEAAKQQQKNPQPPPSNDGPSTYNPFSNGN